MSCICHMLNDANHALLDRWVVCDMLGFGADVYRGVRPLASKWCADSRCMGGKGRPRTATLII